MTQNIEREPILWMGNDTIPIYDYDKSFTVRFPDRCEWKDGLRTNRKGGLIWYRDS
jgi:hypothetical protein